MRRPAETPSAPARTGRVTSRSRPVGLPTTLAEEPGLLICLLYLAGLLVAAGVMALVAASVH